MWKYVLTILNEHSTPTYRCYICGDYLIESIKVGKKWSCAATGLLYPAEIYTEKFLTESAALDNCAQKVKDDTLHHILAMNIMKFKTTQRYGTGVINNSRTAKGIPNIPIL